MSRSIAWGGGYSTRAIGHTGTLDAMSAIAIILHAMVGPPAPERIATNGDESVPESRLGAGTSEVVKGTPEASVRSVSALINAR